jgi:putative aldouronate transport system substrate-binding protein
MGVAYGEAKDVATLADQADDPNYTLVAMPDPTLDGSPNKITALDTGIGYKYGISTSCENVELACQYLNFFYTDEGYELCTYGIEGQASVNGEYTELLTNNDQGLSFDNAFEIYCLADFPCLADGTRYARIYDETTLEACDTWAACADGSYAYPKAATLTADESDEFNGYFTDIKTYVSESILGFITGSLSIEDDWDTFQQQLVDMHINDALSIKAAAYERYIRK